MKYRFFSPFESKFQFQDFCEISNVAEHLFIFLLLCSSLSSMQGSMLSCWTVLNWARCSVSQEAHARYEKVDCFALSFEMNFCCFHHAAGSLCKTEEPKQDELFWSCSIAFDIYIWFRQKHENWKWKKMYWRGHQSSFF